MTIILFLLLLAAAVSPASADDTLDSAFRWFDSFDRDDDGALTIDEMRRLGGKRFRRADVDGDGAINAVEYLRGIPADDETERKRVLKRFQAIDTDKDALATGEEHDAFLALVVEAADADADGVMTRDEFEAAVTGRND